jgi:prepilin-type N-terminal cleavage/methylation domain-containing protein
MTNRTHENGFTLVELAIVMVIVGFLLSGSISLLQPYLQSTQRNATREKLENIGLQLASFAQANGRLPCPAAIAPAVEPFGSPRNSGADGLNTNAQCNTNVGNLLNSDLNNFVGIIPFRALGISEEDARDGYGRFITYAVSPVLAGEDDTALSGGNQIHEQCRTAAWIPTLTNVNPNKARICCPPTDGGNLINDVRVFDNTVGVGTALFSGQHSTVSTVYNDIDIPEPFPADLDTNLVAYVLVSHGLNGDGAYSVGAAGGQIVSSGITSPLEAENSDTDVSFIDRPLTSTEDPTYFDDIVYWRTNQQIINAFGNNSCSRP